MNRCEQRLSVYNFRPKQRQVREISTWLGLCPIIGSHVAASRYLDDTLKVEKKNSLWSVQLKTIVAMLMMIMAQKACNVFRLKSVTFFSIEAVQ